MDFRRILTDAGFSALHRGVSIVAALVLIPVITRLLGADAYGQWVTLLAFAGITAHVGGMYIYSSLIRYYPEEGETAFTSTLTLAFVATGITMGVLFLSQNYLEYIPFDTRAIVSVLSPLTIYISARIVMTHLESYFRAKQLVKRYELVKTIRKIVETGLLVLTFWLAENIVAGLWALVGVTVTFDIVLLAYFLKERPPRPQASYFSKYLRYSIPLIPKGLGSDLLNHFDKFLIIYFLGSTATGIYAVAYTVSSILTKCVSIFNSTLFPNVSAAWVDEEYDEICGFYNVFLRWAAILLVPALIGLFVLSEQIIRFISSPSIAESGHILIPILAVGFGLQAFEIPLSHILAAAEDTGKLAIITFCTVAVNIILNIIFIPTIGLIGAAIATTLAFGLRTIWTYYYTTSYLDLRLPIRAVSKSVVASILMGLILINIPTQELLLELTIYPIVGMLVFFLTFISIGGLESNEWNKIVTFISHHW